MGRVFQEKTVHAGAQLYEKVLEVPDLQRFQWRQQADVQFEIGQFRLGERGEPEVHKGSRVGVLGDVQNQWTPGLKTPDTTSELSVKIQGYKNRSRYPEGLRGLVGIGIQRAAFLQAGLDGIEGDLPENSSVPFVENPRVPGRPGSLVTNGAKNR
jgi:hypothetical protein